MAATHRCDGCERLLCAECIEVGHRLLTCRHCGELAVPLADALSEAHEQGIVHRDLKPANIMVDPRGRPKILDFGLAKLRQEAAAGLSQLPTEEITQEGKILGTYPYMSPEQVEGKPVDHRSDLFSLGTVLYEMATGRRPFTGDSSASVISAILRDATPDVDLERKDLPHHLTRILGRCLAKDPEDRYQRARNLRNDLEELQREVQTGSRTATVPPPRPATRRGLGRGLALGAIGILIAAGIAWVLKPWERSEPSGPDPGPRISALAVLYMGLMPGASLEMATTATLR